MERVLGELGDQRAADARCPESCRATLISAHTLEHCSRRSRVQERVLQHDRRASENMELG